MRKKGKMRLTSNRRNGNLEMKEDKKKGKPDWKRRPGKKEAGTFTESAASS